MHSCMFASVASPSPRWYNSSAVAYFHIPKTGAQPSPVTSRDGRETAYCETRSQSTSRTLRQVARRCDAG